MGIGTSIFLIADRRDPVLRGERRHLRPGDLDRRADPHDRRDPRPDHLALLHVGGHAPPRGRRRPTARSCATASTTRPLPDHPGSEPSSGLSGPGAAPGVSGTCRHSVKWWPRITNATRTSWPAVVHVWPARCREAERADDVAPVVLDLEQPRAARQLVVEPAHLRARLQLRRSSTARRSPARRSSARRGRGHRGAARRPSPRARGAGARPRSGSAGARRGPRSWRPSGPVSGSAPRGRSAAAS